MSIRQRTIECCRAGAIGDVLMTTPALREIRKRYPDARIRYVTLNPDLIINNPDIDELSPVNLPCDKQICFEYPLQKRYPNKPLEQHIAHEFAACGGVELDSIRGNLHLSESEVSYARSVVRKFDQVCTATIHIRAGWSPYKEWPLEKWQQIVDHFFGRIAFIQIGGTNDSVLKNVVSMLGITNIRLSAAFIEVTELFVGIDSYPNHVAGTLNKPAVVIFGSTSPVGSGYPSAINLWSQEPCSPCYREYNAISLHPQKPCPYNVNCMTAISVDQVIASIESVLLNIKEPYQQKEAIL